jgi:hypothetical protein
MQQHVQSAQHCLVHTDTFGAVQGTDAGYPLIFGNDTSEPTDFIADGVRPEFGENILQRSKCLGAHFVPPLFKPPLAKFSKNGLVDIVIEEARWPDVRHLFAC